MKGRFEFKKLAKYPHMMPEDVALWERFIPFHSYFFDSVDYDVHIGEGASFLPTGEDTPDGRQNRLYQRKIDVVGYRNSEIWVIEIKPTADMATLGQILTYRSLCAKDDKLSKAKNFVILCSKINGEMRDILRENRIGILMA